MLGTLAASLAAATPVGQNGIGAAHLGLSRAAYGGALHEAPFVSHTRAGTRLWFHQAGIAVVLDRQGHGTLVSTASPRYALPGGIAPCSPAAKLHGASRQSRSDVYRLGRVWLTVLPSGTIGRVAVSTGRPDLAALASDSQCGSNEVGAGA